MSRSTNLDENLALHGVEKTEPNKELINHCALMLNSVLDTEDVLLIHEITTDDLALFVQNNKQEIRKAASRMRLSGDIISLQARSTLPYLMEGLHAIANDPETAHTAQIKIAELTAKLAGAITKVDGDVRAASGGSTDRFVVTINLGAEPIVMSGTPINHKTLDAEFTVGGPDE